MTSPAIGEARGIIAGCQPLMPGTAAQDWLCGTAIRGLTVVIRNMMEGDALMEAMSV